uniref:ATP synthase mitochondrial F1 complex assembly factor 2 n=1 Tax=Equus caballus TaxID=9796 RepID=A0A9L0S476_HORSE
MLIDRGCAHEARGSDGAPLVSCGRWRRPGVAEASGGGGDRFPYSPSVRLGDPFTLCFLLSGFAPVILPGAMWRSCLRLWDEGRRLLNRPRGGLIASVGPGPNPRLQARAYAPLTERKRFYQNVSITQGEGGFEINLDHRKLKTPQAKLFTVPSEALAIAVATEWDSQQDTIKFYTMHLLQGGRARDISGTSKERVGPGHRMGREEIQKWGNIEWAHDYELQELRARTAAGALFVHLCSESTTVKHKLLRE